MKNRVAKHFDVAPKQVEGVRLVEDDQIRCLINYGIAGTKVLFVPVADLPAAPKARPKRKAKPKAVKK